jgi:peptidoglycan hydrolase-like protein with peptidoglycan-binding domain
MQGSSGPAVEELQRLLGITGKLGFYGPMTVERVKAFQKAKKLEVDGKTGGETWGALLA